MDDNKSNFEKAVDLSLDKWVESIENEMQTIKKIAQKGKTDFNIE